MSDEIKNTTIVALVSAPSSTPLICAWIGHTSPMGCNYYYNGVIGESKLLSNILLFNLASFT